jgi:hypothetical protein
LAFLAIPYLLLPTHENEKMTTCGTVLQGCCMINDKEVSILLTSRRVLIQAVHQY